MIQGVRARLSEGKGCARLRVEQGDHALREAHAIHGTDVALQGCRRIGGHRLRQGEAMQVELSVDGPAEVARSAIRGHHHAAFVFRRVQRVTEVDRRAPLAGGVQGGDKEIQAPHSGETVGCEIEVTSIRVQERPHLLSRRVDHVGQWLRSSEPPIGLDLGPHQIVLSPPGPTSTAGEVERLAIRAQARLAFPPA